MRADESTLPPVDETTQAVTLPAGPPARRFLGPLGIALAVLLAIGLGYLWGRGAGRSPEAAAPQAAPTIPVTLPPPPAPPPPRRAATRLPARPPPRLPAVSIRRRRLIRPPASDVPPSPVLRGAVGRSRVRRAEPGTRQAPPPTGQAPAVEPAAVPNAAVVALQNDADATLRVRFEPGGQAVVVAAGATVPITLPPGGYTVDGDLAGAGTRTQLSVSAGEVIRLALRRQGGKPAFQLVAPPGEAGSPPAAGE